MGTTYIVTAYPDGDKGRYMSLYAVHSSGSEMYLCDLPKPEGLEIFSGGTKLAMTLTPVEGICG